MLIQEILHGISAIDLNVGQGRYGPYGKYGHAESQFHAARTILAHFHHVCRDSTPLSIDAKSRQSLKSALLDDDTIAYVLTIQEQIGKNGS